MITTKELQKLNVGIYEFFWKTGGSSIVSIGVTRDGKRWMGALNWSSTSYIENISDGEVISYYMILDKKGLPPSATDKDDGFEKSLSESFEKLNDQLNSRRDLLDSTKKEMIETNHKARREMLFPIFVSMGGIVLGLGLIFLILV